MIIEIGFQNMLNLTLKSGVCKNNSKLDLININACED